MTGSQARLFNGDLAWNGNPVEVGAEYAEALDYEVLPILRIILCDPVEDGWEFRVIPLVV